MYKELFERLFQGLDILYIADASERFPLQDGCIDLFLSFYGEMEYSLYHKNTQLEDILHLMKPDSLVVGGIQSLEKEAKADACCLSGIRKGMKGGLTRNFWRKIIRNAATGCLLQRWDRL